MREVLEIFFFLFSAGLLSALTFREKGYLLPFRSLGLALSLAIVWMFNLNWILHLPVSLNIFSAIFLAISLIVFISKDKKVSLLDVSGWVKRFARQFVWQKWAFFLFSAVLFLAIGHSYFNGQLDNLRYTTPDPATHYANMSRTAISGFMPLFGLNEIYEVSSHQEGLKTFPDGYFPGATAGFFLLNAILQPAKMIFNLQIFNALFYALISVYFLLLLRKKAGFFNNIIFVLAFGVIALGTFFDLMVNSFSTQLFGLFLLIFFIDIFDEFIEGNIPFLVPMFALAGVIITYLYWVPVALFFIFFRSLAKMEFKKIFSIAGIVSGGGILSIGYIIACVKFSMLSHSVDDGGFSFAGQFLADTMVIMPFSIAMLYGLLKKKFFFKSQSFLGDFAVAAFVYSILLFVGRAKGIVSNYAAMKSLYLTIPLVWALGMKFFTEEDVVSWFKALWGCILSKDKAVIDFKKIFSRNFFFLIIFWVMFVGVVYLKLDIQPEILPLMNKNVSLLSSSKKNASGLTHEQMILLDKIKKDYAWTLDNKQIVVIAPPGTSLWVYSYSGLWPRTKSLVIEGKTELESYAPMGLYSAGIVDYPYWLSHDKNHFIVYFDSRESSRWIKSSGFDFGDYDTLIDSGGSKLLKLKDGIVPKTALIDNAK